MVRSSLAPEAYSASEAVEEAQWLRSVLAEMWPSVPSSLPRSLRTVEMDSLRRPIVTLSDSFNLCQAVKSDKGTGSDKRLRIVTAMSRQVFCGAQGATLAFVTTATMFADALTKALVHCLSLLAAMNARRHVFVTSESSTGVKTTLPMSSEPMPHSQNGNLISADSISRIALWKARALIESIYGDLFSSGIRTSLKPCSVSLFLWPR